ncbi:hypothetical protein [Methylobacterium ajmalii]|nr:hypothetical protein [Methylobacterium ajmalii]MBK3406915.1 hypothetical protein [Methylobacterium ajmalii]MBK3422631.1 hypothetical protein [Methylobacterium ajmalii]
MERALADVDARLDGLRAERDRLVASIAEVEAPEAGEPTRPAGHTEDDREPLLPVTSPRVENALRGIMRDCGFSEAQIATRFPDRTEDATPEPAVLAVVTLAADGRLVVSAPGTPTTRIVALRPKLAGAAAQRVAEVVEDALAERDRQGPGFSEQI